MELIQPQAIQKIDTYLCTEMGFLEAELIRKAGEAVAEEIAARYTGGTVCILCGCGNNGADGYATALSLAARGIPCVAVDVFGKGQRSEGGREVLAAYCANFGAPKTKDMLLQYSEASIIVDAVLGSGGAFSFSEPTLLLMKWMNARRGLCIAIDVPLGVDADLGEVCEGAVRADVTVMLSFPKRGLFSYPARECCGTLVLQTLGLDVPPLKGRYTAAVLSEDANIAARLPVRRKNTHKGSFGKLYLFAGSQKYRGAPQLAALGAARMGAGLLTLVTEKCVVDLLGKRLPELILEEAPPITEWDDSVMAAYVQKTQDAQAVLIGPGTGVSEALYCFVTMLLQREGCPLVLDADALGALALHPTAAKGYLRKSKRAVILTPHPLEFARLCGCTAKEVQAQRMRLALAYAKECGVTLLLKGAGSLITDGERLFINSTGSSALAKGGSGDVLAGAVGAMLAQGALPSDAAAIAAYLHGKAADTLEKELSPYGVIPSDLPKQMAKEIATLLKQKVR